MAETQTDILISGGGIAGLTLALLLADAGADIHLLEPKPPESFKNTKPSGRTVALMDASLNVIKAAGVWKKLEAHAAPLRVMQIVDANTGAREKIEAPFEAQDIGLPQFGFNVPNSALRAALYEAAKKHKSITLQECALKNYTVENGYVFATLSNGKTIKTPLIVGADGRGSKVREIAGIDATTNEYGQAAITCIVNHSRSHDNISTEFHRPGGPLALVPLPGNRSSVVWVEKTQRAEEILRLKKTEFEDLLRKYTGDLLGGLALETTPESWPLISVSAERLTAPRCALMAEAAHVMSPITAQGLNLSLRDAASLAETIIDAMRLGLDHGSDTTLNKYAKRRRLDVATRAGFVDGMNRIVSNDVKALIDLRRAGLKAVHRIAPLKHFAMRHGLAPTLDGGRVTSGKKL